MPSPSDHPSLLPFGRLGDTDASLPAPLESCGRSLYRQVRTAYDRAGRPCGPCDTAMLVWFTFEADIAVQGPAFDGAPEDALFAN